ncbi:hypothetical protein GCM10027189_03080 [Rufibacter soli]
MAAQPEQSLAPIYKGVVVDSATGEPMPGVTIQLEGTSIATPTNVNGEFELKIPTNGLNHSKEKITVSFIGFMTETRLLSELKPGRIEKIALSPDQRKMGEVIVIAGGAVVKPAKKKEQQPGFFQQFKKKKP